MRCSLKLASAPLRMCDRSTPSSAMHPSLGSSSAPMRLRSVVLPEPDGPATTAKSPFSMVKLTPRSACTLTEPCAYTFDTFWTSTTGSDMAHGLDWFESGDAERRIKGRQQHDAGDDRGPLGDGSGSHPRVHPSLQEDAGDGHLVAEHPLDVEAGVREVGVNREAEPKSDAAADDGQDACLRHDRSKQSPGRRTDRRHHAQLSRPLDDRHEHRVEDA